MLVAQAKKACEYFTGNPVPDAEIDRIERLLSRQMENIILIGMPGCGKSTLGVLLAKSLGMTFLDTDLVIQDREHALLSQLIRTHGSDGFLALEESICAQLDVNNSVIATGGSDFHGANHGKPHPVGACVTEDDQIARIEALARKRRGGAL